VPHVNFAVAFYVSKEMWYKVYVLILFVQKKTCGKFSIYPHCSRRLLNASQSRTQFATSLVLKQANNRNESRNILVKKIKADLEKVRFQYQSKNAQCTPRTYRSGYSVKSARPKACHKVQCDLSR